MKGSEPSNDATATSSSSGSLEKTLEAVPLILIIGAGYRGHAYAEPIHASGKGTIAAIVEPHPIKRQAFGAKYIWVARDGPDRGMVRRSRAGKSL
jgi:hypothetical protein